MHEAIRESFSFPTPGEHLPPESDDPLTAILRQGAQRLLEQAIEAEVEQWIEHHAHLTDKQGHRQVVRNGRSPERTLTTGVGPEGEREKFTSKILPPYLCNTKSIAPGWN
jgi:putative transposase